MMKKILIIITVLFSSFFAKAQKWDSVGGGVTGFYGFGDQAYTGHVYSLLADDSVLYIGGFFDWVNYEPLDNMHSGISFATLMDSTLAFSRRLPFAGEWAPLVYSIAKINDNIYLGGSFGTGQDLKTNNCMTWNGSYWDSIGGILNFEVYAMAEYKGKLYIGGRQRSAYSLGEYFFASWNGTHWDYMNYPLGGQKIFLRVNAMTVYNGMLIIGGMFDSAGGMPVHNIAGFDGANWYSLNSGAHNPYRIDAVYSLLVNKGKLYVGGGFDTINNQAISHIAVWDGSVWSGLGSGINGNVLALTYYNGMLYAGGGFDSAGGKPARAVAYWNDSCWNNAGSGLSVSSSPKYSGEVSAMAVYKGSLYVGGLFDSAGGIHCNNLARWTAPWTTDLIIHGNETILFPNPNNGEFTIESSELGTNTTIEIYNVLGQMIYSSAFSPTDYKVSINLGEQAAGVYLYRLITENGEQFTCGKFVIE